MNNNDSWQNDPALKNLDLRKIAFITELSKQMNELPSDKLLPFLMAASRKSQSLNIKFSDEETSLILKVITSNMNPEEKSKADMLQDMIKNFKSQQNKADKVR